LVRTVVKYDEKKEKAAEWTAKQLELEKIEEYKKKKKCKFLLIVRVHSLVHTVQLISASHFNNNQSVYKMVRCLSRRSVGSVGDLNEN